MTDATDATEATVVISIDGKLQVERAGLSLLGALSRQGVDRLNQHPITGMDRSSFCGMGICFECEVVVDGHRSLACLTLVRAGLVVQRGEATGHGRN